MRIPDENSDTFRSNVPVSPWISRRDAIVVAMMATLSFVIENTLGLVLLPLLSGIPLVGGLLSAIPDAAIVFLGAYLVPRRGAIALFAVILLTLSTVTPSFGPPGAYKILIGVGLGLLFEVCLIIFGRRNWTYIFATALSFAASIPVTYLAWLAFDLPGVEALYPRIPFLAGAYFALGAIGAALGLLIYNTRLGKLNVIQRVRTGQ